MIYISALNTAYGTSFADFAGRFSIIAWKTGGVAQLIISQVIGVDARAAAN